MIACFVTDLPEASICIHFGCSLIQAVKYSQLPSLRTHCRDLEFVSSLARVRNNGSLFQSKNCNFFCLGFNYCPYYWGVRYSGVSARQEMAVTRKLNGSFFTYMEYICHFISWYGQLRYSFLLVHSLHLLHSF